MKLHIVSGKCGAQETLAVVELGQGQWDAMKRLARLHKMKVADYIQKVLLAPSKAEA